MRAIDVDSIDICVEADGYSHMHDAAASRSMRWLVTQLISLALVRDVTMGEDASQIATGGGPRIMAGIRNLTISLLRLAGHTNIAKAQRHNARKPQRAIKLVLTS